MPFPLTSAEEVNQWVANATNGHIPHFLADIPHDVMLMLMNAMYFKGETFLLATDWCDRFPFYLQPAQIKEIDNESSFDKCVNQSMSSAKMTNANLLWFCPFTHISR